jgi:hypothetical protein
MIFRILNLFLFLVLVKASIFAQEQFVQFTYYNQLTWSEDGNQLAFRCILLDESNPEHLKSNILVKDLLNDQLICLNPQPERFIETRKSSDSNLYSKSSGCLVFSRFWISG